METVIQSNKECYVCGQTTNLHSHHVFFGSANRKLSEKYGMKVWLCGAHHNQSNAGVHFNRQLDLRLKMDAQRVFEKQHSREEFMQIFGRTCRMAKVISDHFRKKDILLKLMINRKQQD